MTKVDRIPHHIVAENEHGRYCVPVASRHRPASRTVLDARVWEPGTVDLLRSTEPNGDLVHAGAFFGDFIPALARSRQGGSIVWAFEPSHENYRCALQTMVLSDVRSGVLFNAGLAERAGKAQLATTDHSGLSLGGASRIVDDVGSNRPYPAGETVSVVGIDEVIASGRDIAAIHLDVEGREKQALSGAMHTIERCRPVLILELIPEADWVAKNLVPLGYIETGRVDGNHVLRVDSLH